MPGRSTTLPLRSTAAAAEARSSRALQWLTKAASDGHGAAQRNLEASLTGCSRGRRPSGEPPLNRT